MDDIGANIGKLVFSALVVLGLVALAAVYCAEYGYRLGYVAASGPAGAQGETVAPRPLPVDVLIRCLVSLEPADQCAQEIAPPAEAPPAPSPP